MGRAVSTSRCAPSPSPASGSAGSGDRAPGRASRPPRVALRARRTIRPPPHRRQRTAAPTESLWRRLREGVRRLPPTSCATRCSPRPPPPGGPARSRSARRSAGSVERRDAVVGVAQRPYRLRFSLLTLVPADARPPHPRNPTGGRSSPRRGGRAPRAQAMALSTRGGEGSCDSGGWGRTTDLRAMAQSTLGVGGSRVGSRRVGSNHRPSGNGSVDARRRGQPCGIAAGGLEPPTFGRWLSRRSASRGAGWDSGGWARTTDLRAMAQSTLGVEGSRLG